MIIYNTIYLIGFVDILAQNNEHEIIHPKKGRGAGKDIAHNPGVTESSYFNGSDSESSSFSR